MFPVWRLPAVAMYEFPRSVIPIQDKTAQNAKAAADPACNEIAGVRRGDARWEVRSGWRERLLGDGAPDWFDLEREPRATAVKVGHLRVTWRLDLGGSAVFVKAVDSVGLVSQLKRSTLGDSARREWRASLAATACGVGVAPGLAFGIRRGPRGTRSVFVSEALVDVLALSEVWESQVLGVPSSRRRAAAARVIEAVAELFAAAHQRGFAHGDAHPNNILLSAEPGTRGGAVFVDVHGASLTSGPLSLPKALDSLAQLDQYFHRRATRVERLRFLRRYLALGASPGEQAPFELRTLLASFQSLRRMRARVLARHRDRRLRGRGKYFSSFDLVDGWRATATLALSRRHVFAERGVPDRTESDWRVVLGGLLTTIGNVSVSRMMFDRDGFQVEVVRLRGGFRRLIATLFGSPHRRAFELSHKKRHRDVRADLVLACAEHRTGGLIDATVLIRPARECER